MASLSLCVPVHQHTASNTATRLPLPDPHDLVRLIGLTTRADLQLPPRCDFMATASKWTQPCSSDWLACSSEKIIATVQQQVFLSSHKYPTARVFVLSCQVDESTCPPVLTFARSQMTIAC